MNRSCRKRSPFWKSSGIAYEMTVSSAHRNPDRTGEYGRTAEARGLKVIIAGAGLAAALPGVMAAHTTLPVIGVPIASGRAERNRFALCDRADAAGSTRGLRGNRQRAKRGRAGRADRRADRSDVKCKAGSLQAGPRGGIARVSGGSEAVLKPPAVFARLQKRRSALVKSTQEWRGARSHDTLNMGEFARLDRHIFARARDSPGILKQLLRIQGACREGCAFFSHATGGDASGRGREAGGVGQFPYDGAGIARFLQDIHLPLRPRRARTPDPESARGRERQSSSRAVGLS